MGTCVSLSYACLFAGFLEQFLVNNYTGTIPHFFLLHIDNCISVALCSHNEFERFINFTMTLHCAIKLTWAISDTSFPFLELSVSIS
eukprot:g37025.t1